MKPVSLWRCVVRKEIREVVRDGRMRALGVIVVVLALAALAFGLEQTHRERESREHARERALRQWEGQGEKNPHVAAHYGTYAFAPASAATAIDPGVSMFLGRAVKLEAHRRNLAGDAAAQDAAGTRGFFGFSVTTVLLQLLPLLIIALGYGVWTRERERGTLRQLMSTGVDRRVLLWGKAGALFIVVAALLLPAATVVTATLLWLGGGGGDTLLRLGLLGLGYLLYFGIYGGLTLYASAKARSSRAALVGMIGLWGLFSLITPRVASEIAAWLRPLPSRAELARAVGESLEKGIDGVATREVAVEAIASDLMAAEGLADTGMMVDEAFVAGFELRAEAQWEDQVFDHHVGRLEDQIAAQEGLIAWMGLLSPYVAMGALSSGLCGTDYAHHRHFTDYAEAWRKELVNQLNTAFAENAGAEGWEYEAGPELWKKAPPFAYDPPGAAFALHTHARSIVSLLIWLALSFLLALHAARRLRVV